MPNANRAIWATDWHMVSNDTEFGGVPQSVAGGMHPTDSSNLAAHFNFLDPAIVFDTGDCKDHYGTDAGVTDEHDNYITYVRSNTNVRWATVNADAGVTATRPILPGNHDQEWDSQDSDPTHDTSLTSWNARFWGPPYHFTFDWAAPQIRFIGLHTHIIHLASPLPDGYEGWAEIDPAEVTFMTGIVDALPTDWTAIIMSHHPLETDSNNGVPGNSVRPDTGGAALYAAMAARSSKIMAALSGHRHFAHNTVQTFNGVTSICAPGVSYRATDTLGRFNLLDYNPATRIVTMTERKATLFTDPPNYDSTTTDGVTVTIQLPPAGTAPPPTPSGARQENLVALGF